MRKEGGAAAANDGERMKMVVAAVAATHGHEPNKNLQQLLQPSI